MFQTKENIVLDQHLNKFLQSDWFKSAFSWVKSRYSKSDLEVRIKLSVHAAMKLFALISEVEPSLSVDRSQKEVVVVLAALLAAMDQFPPGWGEVVGDKSVYWDVNAAIEYTRQKGKLPLVEAEIVRLALVLDRVEINRKFAVSDEGVVESVHIQKGKIKPAEIHFGCRDRLGKVQAEKLYREVVEESRLRPYVCLRIFAHNKEVGTYE